METTKKATFTVNELKDSVKSKLEFAGLYAKLASVKTVEYGIKGIVKVEKLAKQTTAKMSKNRIALLEALKKAGFNMTEFLLEMVTDKEFWKGYFFILAIVWLIFTIGYMSIPVGFAMTILTIITSLIQLLFILTGVVIIDVGIISYKAIKKQSKKTDSRVAIFTTEFTNQFEALKKSVNLTKKECNEILKNLA